MFLDGDPVNVGDTVFDIQRGPGEVVEILPGNFARATFGPSRFQMTFSQSGQRQGSDYRMVFWANPVMAAPFKDSKSWSVIAAAVTSIIQALREAKGI